MIEVFITNIQNQIQAERMLKTLETSFPELTINFDIGDSKLPFPCGHNILRVEGATINSESIISMMNKSGFQCDILKDKVCI